MRSFVIAVVVQFFGIHRAPTSRLYPSLENIYLLVFKNTIIRKFEDGISLQIFENYKIISSRKSFFRLIQEEKFSLRRILVLENRGIWSVTLTCLMGLS